MDYLQTDLEVRVVQLQNENNSLLQKEVSECVLLHTFIPFKRLGAFIWRNCLSKCLLFNIISYHMQAGLVEKTNLLLNEKVVF